MSRNIQCIIKWFPNEINHFRANVKFNRELGHISRNLLLRLSYLLDNLRKGFKNFHSCIENEFNVQELEKIESVTREVVTQFDYVFQQIIASKNDDLFIIAERLKIQKYSFWKIKLKINYLLSDLINNIAYLYIYYGEVLLKITLGLTKSYNSLLKMDSKYDLKREVNVYTNTCPYLLFPLRKISVTKLLQIIANNRAELCCHKLIDCLLETYKLYDANGVDDENEEATDNSSLEIYKALTKHMSPTDTLDYNPADRKKLARNRSDYANETFLSIEELISYEEKNIVDLLEMIVEECPEMLGHESVTKKSGITRIRSEAQIKALSYYTRILWCEVGLYLEHIVLWWGAAPLSARPPHSVQHLREWIVQFVQNLTSNTTATAITTTLNGALIGLADALGVHVAVTSWDRLFGRVIVASDSAKGINEGAAYFQEVFGDLVALCNQCETTIEWSCGAPLNELPIVEQIPVLHRLDHTIHTVRLWALSEVKRLANHWNVDGVFKITHCIIVDCLSRLSELKYCDHSIEIEKGSLEVHVQVCAMMRAKLVSEVNANLNKLKETPSKCIQCLASICKTISLANLKMIFPNNPHWSQPSEPSLSTFLPLNYVEKYLNQMLLPVVSVSSDVSIANMILQLICDAWLDHIFRENIKFTDSGALQLLADFKYVEKWLMECSSIGVVLRQKMLKNEVLRRCEGVGRLLLRRPGDHLKMFDKKKNKIEENEEDESNTQLMPAEMYVPNQEKWLTLRAPKRRGFFKSAICGKF